MNLVQSLLLNLWNHYRNCLTKSFVKYPDILESSIQARISFYSKGIKYYQSICNHIASNLNDFLQAYECTEITKTFEYYCLKVQSDVLQKIQEKEVEKFLDMNPMYDRKNFEIN